jgi:hypothetical protein
MLYCINGCFPTIPSKETLNSITLERIRVFITNRIASVLKRTFLLKPLKYELHTCSKATTDYKVDKCTKIVEFNSTDFVRANNVEDNLENHAKYCLFIDQNMTSHPDFNNRGMYSLTESSYYDGLINLFRVVQKQTGLEIIVAAHPTANYSNCNPFGNIKIVYGKTVKLSKNASLIITHYSTAFSYGVIFKKPLLFVTSDEIIKRMPSRNVLISTISNLLQAPVCNIDHLQNFELSLSYNVACYDKYKYDYITNRESEELTNDRILLNILNGLYE